MLSNYDPGDMTVPNALCTNCCIALYNSESSQQNSAPPLIKACAYYIECNGRPAEAMHTRACSATTTCDICLTARQLYKKPHKPCICHICTQFNSLKTTSKLALEKPTKKTEFTTNNILNIQSTLNLSNAQVIKFAGSLRSICGRNAVEPGLKEKLVEIPKKVEKFYSHTVNSFLVSKKDGYQDRVMVYCNDIEALVSYVLDERKYDPYNHLVRIGLDGGGGMFKIVVNIIDTTGLHSTGIFKDTSVKRTIILAVVEDISESDDNLKFILSKIKNFDKIKYHICSDVKLMNILIGIQSCASKHPCAYCESDSNFNTLAEHRTLGSIRHSASAFKAIGSLKKVAKQYKNCVNQPLITGNDDEYILDICVPPELHLMQGIVKHIYDNMCKDWPKVSLWLSHICVYQKNYHHGAFVGNDCMRMLKNVDVLQHICELHNMHIMQKYVHIMRCLYDVVISCFGMKLNPEYDTYIKRFSDVYKDLDISVTPKVHILIKHVPEFIKKHNRSLGWYSEQSLETTHYDFKRNCWEKQGYKRSLGHTDYAQNLMKAVIVYSSKNIS